MSARAQVISFDASRATNRVPDALSNVFENAITAVAIFDENGRTIYANREMKALAERFGYPIATLLDLAPNEQTSAAYIDFDRFRAGKLETVRLRYAIGDRTGADYWADMSMGRYAFDFSATPMIIVQVVDVTAEMEAKATTLRNEARWEAALGAARQGVWDHDARTGKVTYSRMWRLIRGMAADEEVDGKRETWLTRLHPDDRARIESTVGKQETGEDGYDTLHYRERHRDGHYVWIYSRGKPIEWDENGNVLRTIGTDTDITHQKEIEAELAVEKERLQVTLQSIADGVISTDAEGRISFINRSAERMTGWSQAEAIGKPIHSVFDTRIEGDADKPAASVETCLRRGRPYRVAGYSLLKGKNTRARYIREMASPVRTEAGEIIGAVMVFRDATQRRRLQRELEYSATHDPLTDLANRVAFETALEGAVRSSALGEGHHALCLIDLDHFKAVNDGAGHSAGDALLQELGKLLRESCRETDFVARLGGDEFGVILRNCSLKMARNVAQKIVDRIHDLSFVWQDESFQVGASVGITAIDGQIEASVELYRNADSACYAAKRNGRGCVVVYG